MDNYKINRLREARAARLGPEEEVHGTSFPWEFVAWLILVGAGIAAAIAIVL